jgi:flagellar biosynthesis protein FlhF
MHLKWFRGRAVPDLMQQIRQELGPDALILHTKSSAPWGPLRLVRGGGIEILAAVDEAEPRPAMPRAPASHGEHAPADETRARIAQTAPAAADGLRAEVATLKNLLVQFGGARLLPPDLAPYYERLVAGGVEPTLALRLLGELPITGAADPDPDASATRIDEALARMIRTGGGAADPRVAAIALVGPGGAGKTVTLAKLAARAHMQRGGTAILDLDTGGWNAPGPLETLAAILDVSYAAPRTAEEVAQKRRQSPVSGLTLIDTPAVGLGENAGLAPLADLLAAAEPDEIHLVLPATMKTGDAVAAVRACATLGATHLLFTRLDETTSCGSVLGVSLETGLPLSYFGTGRQIPGDLALADPMHIIHRTLRHGACHV